MVESQHRISTRKLVDSDAEQQLLEELIDRAKPVEPESPRLHYLLRTPFRYPPLPYGSRFGDRSDPGIWYGAEDMVSNFAEVAYYRLFFLEGSRALINTVTVELTSFHVRVRTGSALDLTRPPFKSFRSEISAPNSYSASQSLGRDLRRAEILAVRYYSARAKDDGINLAVFSKHAFAQRSPVGLATWTCTASRARVEFSRKHLMKNERHSFEREQFLVHERLPHPAG